MGSRRWRRAASWLVAVVASLWSMILSPTQLRAQTSPSPGDVETVVVPIHGAIDVSTAAIVRRGFAEARAHSAGRVLLDIDTPGGLESEMREVETVLAQMRAEGMHTAAFVRRQALSAGAYIALAARDVFMAPDASLGAITPVLADPLGGGIVAIPDDDVRHKVYAAMRADVRALVEARRSVRRDVLKAAEAMVDPTLRLFDVTYEDRNGMSVQELMFVADVRQLEAEGVKIIGRREFGSRPLVLTADEAIRLGFAKAKASSIEVLVRDEYGSSMGHTLVLAPSWSEDAVQWLDGMKPVLLILGLLLLLVEMKTPGFFVPGILGIALLGLAMFGSYLVGLADISEILLLVLGLIALAVEIFFIPGSIVFGAIGFVAVVAAMILSQQPFVLPGNETETQLLTSNLLHLLLVTLGVIVAFGAYVKLLPYIPFMNRVLLTPPVSSASPAGAPVEAATRMRALLGGVAVAATDLRPSGIVEFGDGARYDAVTRGEFIDAGQRVRVVQQAYQRLVVEVDAQGGESGQVSLGLLFLLIAVGLALIVAEIFFVSFGVLGGVAALSLLSAIVLAFTHHGLATGFLFLGMAAVGAPVVALLALRVLPKTWVGRRLILSGPSAAEVGSAATPDLAGLLHAHGVAESVLRPAGIARLAGRRVDVVTRGELIEAGTAVTVLAIEGSRVVVAAARAAPTVPEGA